MRRRAAAAEADDAHPPGFFKQDATEVRYKGDTRVVEPHDYGHQKGADRVLGYQLRTSLAPFAKEAIGWRLFDVAKIESLVILETTFKGSRGESDQDHHRWDVLYARVEIP